jgi:glycosyltransferase involved in cell wall biosynthesis
MTATPAPRATVVYWQSLEDLPRDGGGLRVRAWRNAMQELGYRVEVAGLQSAGATSGRGRGRASAMLHAGKQRLAPLPSRRDFAGPPSDVTVVTVPAAVPSAASRGGSVVIDWMDLWSEVASTWTRTAPNLDTRAGARVQRRLWVEREDRAFAAGHQHTFAGWGDADVARTRGVPSPHWLPTPVTVRPLAPRAPRPVATVGMIGNFDHRPNVDALHRFLAVWGPTLRGREVGVVVAGLGSEDLAVPGWVRRTGRVGDLSAFYDTVDAVVVPVELGGGIKVKALEGLVHGVPVFGTDHVRGGLPPSWRHAVRPLERGWLDAAVGGADLDLSPLTAAAFADGVRTVLDRRETAV